MQTFRDFMESALYDPEQGFYSRRLPTADFYTAPELHPAFGGTLAFALAQELEALKAAGVPGPYTLVEMGSGAGLLARQVLGALKREKPALCEGLVFVLVERAREVLIDSLLELATLHPRVLGHDRLEDAQPFKGVLYSNELVDAFPVHVLEKQGDRVLEVYVAADGSATLGELSDPRLKPAAAAVAETLAEGERHAVNLEAERWLELAAGKLETGCILTVDYGKRYSASDINRPRSFIKHSSDFRIVDDKGRRDLTANVDFAALERAGKPLGLSPSFSTLSAFLIKYGVERWLPNGDGVDAIRQRGQIKTLLHPEGMGEAFKVLFQRKARRA